MQGFSHVGLDTRFGGSCFSSLALDHSSLSFFDTAWPLLSFRP